jgi:beta-lactamase regulating signal transducer with metallopeptidase domain
MQSFLSLGLSNGLMATVLAAFACIAGRCFRQPAVRHTLWLLVLLKLVTPPFVTLPMSWPALEDRGQGSGVRGQGSEVSPMAGQESVASGVTEIPALQTQEESLLTELAVLKVLRDSEAEKALAQANAAPDWTGWAWMSVLALWASGSVAWFGVALFRIRSFQKLLEHGEPASEALQEQAQRIAGRIGLFHCPEVWLIPGRLSPLFWSLGSRQRLVLPAELFNRLQRQQQDALLAHELAHARRRDHWVRWVELAATGLYWWHPVVWWARHELHQAEEECCDAWVVWTLPAAAKAYARALLQTVDFLDVRPALPPVASGIGHVTLLKRRVDMIVNSRLCPRLPWPACLAAILAGCLVLPIAPQRLTAALMNDDDDKPAQRNPENKIRELERRMSAIESKLDRLLEQRTPRAAEGEEAVRNLKQQAERMARDAERQKKDAERQVKEAKKQAEKAHARAMEEMHKHMIIKDDAGEGGDNKEIRKRVIIRDKAREDGKDGKKDIEKIIINGHEIDLSHLEHLKDLEKHLDEVVHKSFNPERMEKLQVQIQDAVKQGMNAERLEKLEKQIEESVHRNINPERLEALAKQIEATVNKSVQAQQRERERGPAAGSPGGRGAGAGVGTGSSSGSARASSRPDLEKRLDKLEEKMDKLIQAVERNQQRSNRRSSDKED